MLLPATAALKRLPLSLALFSDFKRTHPAQAPGPLSIPALHHGETLAQLRHSVAFHREYL